MKHRFALGLGGLAVLAYAFVFFSSRPAKAQCATFVNCVTCGLSACDFPHQHPTSDSVQVDQFISYDCNTALTDALKCGRSDYCDNAPIPVGCPGHGEDPPPPPTDPWRCRWTTISASGFNSCFLCWMTEYAYVCCELPS